MEVALALPWAGTVQRFFPKKRRVSMMNSLLMLAAEAEETESSLWAGIKGFFAFEWWQWILLLVLAGVIVGYVMYRRRQV